MKGFASGVRLSLLQPQTHSIARSNFVLPKYVNIKCSLACIPTKSLLTNSNSSQITSIILNSCYCAIQSVRGFATSKDTPEQLSEKIPTTQLKKNASLLPNESKITKGKRKIELPIGSGKLEQLKQERTKEKGNVTHKKQIEQLKEEAFAVTPPVESKLERLPLEHRLEEPAFAIVLLGGSQYKVVAGDVIMSQKLIGPDIGDRIVLDKILLVGTRNWTAIGTPLLSQASVHAVVEEQTKTEKAIIFKKKRRKNYRRTKGHRQDVTTLRITDLTFNYNKYLTELESPPIDKSQSQSTSTISNQPITSFGQHAPFKPTGSVQSSTSTTSSSTSLA